MHVVYDILHTQIHRYWVDINCVKQKLAKKSHNLGCLPLAGETAPTRFCLTAGEGPTGRCRVKTGTQCGRAASTNWGRDRSRMLATSLTSVGAVGSSAIT